MKNFKQLKGQLKENDIKIEEGLRLLDGDFMQYRKLIGILYGVPGRIYETDAAVDDTKGSESR